MKVGFYTAANDHLSLEVVKQLKGSVFMGFGAVNVRLTVWGFSKVCAGRRSSTVNTPVPAIVLLPTLYHLCLYIYGGHDNICGCGRCG